MARREKTVRFCMVHEDGWPADNMMWAVRATLVGGRPERATLFLADEDGDLRHVAFVGEAWMSVSDAAAWLALERGQHGQTVGITLAEAKSYSQKAFVPVR